MISNKKSFNGLKYIYSFILGHSPKLSQAEIESVLKFRNIDFQIIGVASQFLVLETSQELDVENLNQTLGGIIKIGKLEFFTPHLFENKKDEGRVDKLDNIENLNNTFVQILKSNCNLENKLKFGFSIYSRDRSLQEFVFKLSLSIKKALKKEKISSRVVTSKEKDLSAVIIEKEHLIESGFDIQVLNIRGRFYFMRTLAVQNFARFNALDYERPRIDSKSGMMPPKLAKIMLNLADNRGIILDPFCGSGTILLMAGELRFEKIIGTDISKKAVQDSIENLKWYEERFDNKISNYIFKSDVKDLLQEGIEENSIDCIVSEGYLGKPLKGDEDFNFIQEQISDLSDLYLNSFKTFKDLLKNKGCVIITLPIFIFNNRENHLEIVDEIKKMGFQQEDLLENEQSLIYKREGQRVYREVIKLRVCQ